MTARPRLVFLVIAVVAVVVAGAAWLLLRGGGPHDAPAVTGPTPTTAAQVPYDPEAPINQPVPADAAADPRSAAIVARLVSNIQAGGLIIAAGDETPPVYVVHSTDPFLSLHVDGKPQRFRVPAAAVTGSGADAPLMLLDPDHPDLGRDVELRMFKAHIDRANGVLYGDGASLGHYNNDGRRLNPDGSRSVGVPFLGHGTGSGLSMLAGLVRSEEVRAGAIHHALRFAYSAPDFTNAFRSPAVHTDQPKGGVTRDPASAMDMGMRLRLDPAVDCSTRTVPHHSDTSGPTRFLRVVCRALQRYGMVALDGSTDGHVLLEMEGDATAHWGTVIGPTYYGGWGYTLRPKGVRDGLGRDGNSGIPWDRMQVVAGS